MRHVRTAPGGVWTAALLVAPPRGSTSSSDGPGEGTRRHVRRHRRQGAPVGALGLRAKHSHRHHSTGEVAAFDLALYECHPNSWKNTNLAETTN